VDAERADATTEAVTTAYAKHGFTAPTPFVAVPSAGASRL